MLVVVYRKINDYRQNSADNQNISFFFLPATFLFSPISQLSRAHTRMHCEFLPLLFLQSRDALHCHWNAIATQSIRLVQFQSSRILPVNEEQSRTRSHQNVGVEDQPQCQNCVIVAAPVHDPSHTPLLLPLLLSHKLPLPRVH
jgi:hypothetical protein